MRRNTLRLQFNHPLYNRDNEDYIKYKAPKKENVLPGGINIEIYQKNGELKCKILGFCKRNRLYGQVKELKHT
jgi:hypothetical protein